ncbi:MAG: hypothetical protein ABSC23_02345 [Bryobacteraceae bacterium]|jgi:predicted acyl esterase
MATRRELSAGLAVWAILMSPPGASQTRPYSWPEPKFKDRREENVKIPMRDGVRLSTDLYSPIGADARLPVILIRSTIDCGRRPKFDTLP